MRAARGRLVASKEVDNESRAPLVPSAARAAGRASTWPSPPRSISQAGISGWHHRPGRQGGTELGQLMVQRRSPGGCVSSSPRMLGALCSLQLRPSQAPLVCTPPSDLSTSATCSQAQTSSPASSVGHRAEAKRRQTFNRWLAQWMEWPAE